MTEVYDGANQRIGACGPQNASIISSRCITQPFLARPKSLRAYSTAASSTSLDSASVNAPSASAIAIPKISIKTHLIHAGIILSRPPLLTPCLHPFEKAYFFYQKRLNERLAIPFTRYFYFKKGAPANADWKIKQIERGGVPAKELGTYNSYGKEAWNDELLVKDKSMAEPQYVIDQLVKDARIGVTEDGVVVEDPAARLEGVEKPRDRITEADLKNYRRSLDRKLDRTLYLVVQKKGQKTWCFPSANIIELESLRQAAERILVQSCGPNMNTWIVGCVPIAFDLTSREARNLNGTDKDMPRKGIATFFMKGRIMTGQADLLNNKFNLVDYRWLTREELSRALPSNLYSSVCDALHER